MFLCPDLKVNDNFSLQGISNNNFISNTISTIMITINKCNNDSMKNLNISIECESDDKFNIYSKYTSF